MKWLARSFAFILLFTVGAVALGLSAQEIVEDAVPSDPYLVPAETIPAVPVRAYVVFDPETGAVLYAYNSSEPLPIASITKLFAAAAIVDSFELEDTTVLSWADVAAHGTAGRLESGQAYSYRDLLFPLLLSSSNDAALTFRRRSEAVDDSVVSRAQRLASRIAPSIQFADASGLSAGNIASAADLAQATSQLRKTHPYVFDITRLRSYVGPYHGWQNNSPFIDDRSYRGGKHGFTNAAGRTAVAFFNEEIAGHEWLLGYVVLGSSDLQADMSVLRTQVRNSVDVR